jgi:hypothetical protein
MMAGIKHTMLCLKKEEKKRFKFAQCSVRLTIVILSVTCDTSVVFSEYSGSSTNKTDRRDIAEILLKVALNTITLTPTYLISFSV